MRETATSVSSAMGDMRAVVYYPDSDTPLPGPCGGCGAVILTHDKPGCGGSPGDWRDQTLAGRASDSLAALEVLRHQPGVDPDRVGFLGISQGGWVSYLAASMAPRAVRHVVTISGAGVSPA